MGIRENEDIFFSEVRGGGQVGVKILCILLVAPISPRTGIAGPKIFSVESYGKPLRVALLTSPSSSDMIAAK
jgi:hypothetical protein